MEAQIGLGADIIMAFDECTEYPAEGERARQSMELTLRWAARSKKHFEQHCHEVPWRENHVGADALVHPAERSSAASGHSNQSLSARLDRSTLTNSDPPTSASLRSPARTRASGPTRGEATQALFGIVQGGMNAALRRESAERTIEIGFPGYAIGGLSVGEPRALTREIVAATLEHLPTDQPRYLMGVGTPEEIVEYSNLGIDMMDCVLPTRAARHGLLFTSQGRISIKQARYAGDQGPLDPDCGCRVCRRYSRAYLRHLYAANEVLAQVLNTVHNLSFYLDTMRSVRHSIALGNRAQLLAGDRSGAKP
jgi:queuine tRNA-ribosyltransferase